MSDERYHATHDTFEEASNQRSLILEWFERWADQALATMDHLHVLSVGCGGGTMDMQLADLFARHCRTLSLAAVDPNPLHTRAFAECFADRVAEVTVATSPFETCEIDHPFDVIHFIHCLYYIEDLDAALDKAIGLLRPGGSLIVLNAPREALNHLAHRLWRKQWNRTAWYSDDILAALEKRGGTIEHQRIEAQLDVSTCRDPADEHGRCLLDFTAQVDSRLLEEPLQKLLHEYLLGIAQSGGDGGNDDRAFAPHPVDGIVFRRQ